MSIDAIITRLDSLMSRIFERASSPHQLSPSCALKTLLHSHSKNTLFQLKPLHPQPQPTVHGAQLTNLANPTHLALMLCLVLRSIERTAHARTPTVDRCVAQCADIELGEWVELDVELVRGPAALALGFDFLRLEGPG